MRTIKTTEAAPILEVVVVLVVAIIGWCPWESSSVEYELMKVGSSLICCCNVTLVSLMPIIRLASVHLRLLFKGFATYVK